MRRIVEVSSEQYEEMRKQPLFFVRFNKRIFTDNEGKEHDDSEWLSVDRDLNIVFPAGDFGIRDLDYSLCIIEGAVQSKNSMGKIKEDRVDMYFHDASPSNVNDYQIILNNYIVRGYDKYDKFRFVELLWFLDKQNIEQDALSKAIGQFDRRTILTILDLIRHIARCLSFTKQNIIKSLFESLGGKYDIYMPSIITDAVRLCNPTLNKSNLNLFQLIDEVIGNHSIKSLAEQEIGSNNMLLQLKKWLHSEKALEDYSSLKPLFSMVAEPIRLEIVKRYFHDIRLGNTTLDTELLAQFKDNHFGEFIRFRYATETPAERIVLTVPLLCDNILTLHNSRGSTFQTFDGILDFAMTNCDKAHPGIDFKLNRFIPTCDNGSVYNSSEFKGFIDYQLIRKINKDLMTDSSLFYCIRKVLDRYGRRQQYPVCKYGDGSKIEDSQFTKCSHLFTSRKNPSLTSKLECYSYRKYEDRWLVYGNEINILVLNSFLAENVRVTNKDLSIDLSMISLDVFRDYILSLPSLFEEIGNEEFLVHSYKSSSRTYNLMLVELYSDILRMRILPQKGALVSRRFDVFGLWKKQKETLTPDQANDSNSPEYKAAYERYLVDEIKEVNTRTIESLKKELKIQEYNGSYFEVSFQRSLLVKIINKYYFKETFVDDENLTKHEFLTLSYSQGDFKTYCAPKLSEANNPAIDLPYFWCRGRECFHNNLDKQTLSETDDWHEYSLYHLIEIIGYPKLHSTIAGNEPDPVVWNFIAVTNKVMQKFRRLKCRSCGHLMFTDHSSGFNRYNYYSCINPNCSEFQKPVYLSYCYKCKKGLIDSRDTKQCPNKWYICPTCLACCDDAQYERQAQRYILSNRPVPDRIQRMLGLGHNDKGDYFCPDCGSHIEIIKNENGESFRGCPSCHKIFDLIPDGY